MTDVHFQRLANLLRDGLALSKQGSYERRMPNAAALPKIKEALKGLRELATDNSPAEVWRQLALAEEALLHYPAAVSALEKAIARSQRPDKKDIKRLALLTEYAQKWALLGLTPSVLAALGQHLDIALRVTPCDHTHKNTITWLTASGISNQRKVLAAFKSHGGYCDCEVLANVV